MARTRYEIMKASNQTNSDGNNYPDVMTFPIEKFVFTDPGKNHILTRSDLDRFDILCIREYGVSYYDDIVLWLNNIDNLKNVTPGNTIFLPTKRDLDRFFTKNLR